ncbi:uncharacterized protein LOC143230770 [Tachypleus tridentatus]|uniref:uncharacterized protein LOC143230770 n=1 Tax=Tachypleus tridentatus TaxID=6853 RepID=UPI003FD1E61D
MSEKPEVVSPSISVKERAREINARVAAADGQVSGQLKWKEKVVWGTMNSQQNIIGVSEDIKNETDNHGHKETSELEHKSYLTNVPLSKVDTRSNITGVSKVVMPTNDAISELCLEQNLAHCRVCGSNYPKIADHQKQQACGCVNPFSQRRETVKRDASVVPYESSSDPQTGRCPDKQNFTLCPSVELKKDVELSESCEKRKPQTSSAISTCRNENGFVNGNQVFNQQAVDQNVCDNLRAISEDSQTSYRVSFTLHINDSQEVPKQINACTSIQDSVPDHENKSELNQINLKNKSCVEDGELKVIAPTRENCTLERPFSGEEVCKTFKDSACETTYVSKSEPNERSGEEAGAGNRESIFRQSSALDKLPSHSREVNSVSSSSEQKSVADVSIQAKQSPLDDILRSLEKICNEFDITSAEISSENTKDQGDFQCIDLHAKRSGDIKRQVSDSTFSSGTTFQQETTKSSNCSCKRDKGCTSSLFCHSNAETTCDNDFNCNFSLPKDFSNANLKGCLKHQIDQNISKVPHDFHCECSELDLSFTPEFIRSKFGDYRTDGSDYNSRFNDYDNVNSKTFIQQGKDALMFPFETKMNSRAKTGKYHTFSNKVKDKASKVHLVPNFHITTLTKVLPSPTELNTSQASRSLPSTPLAPRANFQVRSKPDLPAYLTLGRKRGLRRGSEGNRHELLTSFSQNDIDDGYIGTKDITQIRNILAGLDFSKFRRGRGEEDLQTEPKISLPPGESPENDSNYKDSHRDNLFLNKYNETTKSFHGSLTEVKPTKDISKIFQRSTSVLASNNVYNSQRQSLEQYNAGDLNPKSDNLKSLYKTLDNTDQITDKNLTRNIGEDIRNFHFNTLKSRIIESSQLQGAPKLQYNNPSHNPVNMMSQSESPKSISISPHKNGNSKLKQLTEKLKPQSPSTAPASPTFKLVKDSESSGTSGTKSPLVNRSSSFSHVDVTPEGSYKLTNDSSSKDSTQGFSSLFRESATLPRKRITQFSSLSDKNPTTKSKSVQDNTLTPPSLELSKSDLSVDSVVDSAVDEGLVPDSDCPSYSHEYSSVTTTNPKSRDSKSSVSCIRDGPNTYVGVGLGTRSLPSETRKRRKGFRGHTVGFKLGLHETKSSNGRLLTYPPQRRSSVSEDELEYTSVDSNGLKSLKMSQGLSSPINEDALRQTSDLSLADSHFSHGENIRDETYRDILEKVTGESNRLTIEDRNVKALKKKYHSDPSRENTGMNVHLPEIITTCNSEPKLYDFDNSEGSQQRGLRLEIKESVNDDSNTALSNIMHGQTSQSPGFFAQCPSPQPSLSGLDFEIDKERLMTKSPQQQRRYSKKRLRGPYGEMLEEEMRKSGEKQKPNFSEDLSFLQEISEEKNNDDFRSLSEIRSRPNSFPISQSLDDTDLKRSTPPEVNVPRRKISANIPFVQSDSEVSHLLSPPPVTTSSSDPNLSQSISDLQISEDNCNLWNQEEDVLVYELTKQSELARARSIKRHQDTRTHVVGELYDTEKSYVESLQILVNKYMKPLKSPDNAGIVEPSLVDEIFHQIPEILVHHEGFLEMLRQRLANWDTKQKVGDVFVEAFTKQHVIDTYTAFINNWKTAKDAIKLTTQAKPAFHKFLEHMAREHKGKLTLDALLIMPVQRIPRYELLIKELLKHTPVDHPDHQSLVLAQKEIHELAVKINRMEREAFQHDQMQQRIREVENLIEGAIDLVQPDRTFIRYDLVTISGGLGMKKERCLFLFSDLLIITSIKRKSGTIRKTSLVSTSPSTFGTLEMNKYKMLMRFSLDNLDIVKSADVSLKRTLKEVEHLEKDLSVLGQINDLASALTCQHQVLDEAVQDLLNIVNKQLVEKQSGDSQLVSIELAITTQEGVDTICIVFPNPEKKSSWETAFNEAKQKLALSTDRRPPPEFLYPLPIRKTRAGLQFTCSAATLGLNQFGLKDVWVCNSDGYVGQVCILCLQPEPTVTSCNGVCNARILCIASIPAANSVYNTNRRKSVFTENNTVANFDMEEVDKENDQRANNGNFQLDSDSSDEEEEIGEPQDEDSAIKNNSSTGNSLGKEDIKEETDHQQPTMWLGTEDGCIHIYNCNDNIRIKKNKIKIQHSSAIQCIIYFDNRVFLSLASGELCVYRRSTKGGWNTAEVQRVQAGSVSAPVSRMLAIAGKLWCGCQNCVKILNTNTLEEEHCFQVSSDTSRAVLCLVTSGLGVWVAIQHSAVLRLFHATSYENLLDVNVAPAVTKMLAGCDDIIRQHKAACLRVTALLACKDLLWVGTSAGVILSLPLPHLTSSTSRLDNVPNVSGVPHGHTGHVRFLTCVEMTPGATMDASGCAKYTHRSIRGKEGAAARRMSSTTSTGCRLLVISGGDGYEDFCHSGLSETAGRDDSTNHLLLWQV